MKNKKIELTWQNITEVASGKGSSGLPRSAATLAIDQVISDNETTPVQEVFLDSAIINIHSSGGAAVVVADFPYEKRGFYRKSKSIAENWLKDINLPSEKEQLSLCITPLALEGQVFLFYTQLMFVDGYEYKGNCRLILGFDNTATFAIETEDIDYNKIQVKIAEELRYYEDQIDSDISEALEEEKLAKEQENIMDLEMQERLNNPIDILLDRESCEEEHSSVRFVEDGKSVRFNEEE